MVDTMEQDKLKTLLRLRYHNSVQDTVADLGNDVGQAFAGFQKYLYQDAG
jgi:type I restriction enzyme R subunit